MILVAGLCIYVSAGANSILITETVSQKLEKCTVRKIGWILDFGQKNPAEISAGQILNTIRSL